VPVAARSHWSWFYLREIPVWGVPSAVKALIPHNRTGIQARGVLVILKKNGCFYRWDCLFSHWAKVNGHVMRVPEIKSVETTAFR
jgi:hypothetical protein